MPNQSDQEENIYEQWKWWKGECWLFEIFADQFITLVTPDVFVLILYIIDSETTYKIHTAVDEGLCFPFHLLEHSNEKIKDENVNEKHVKTQENVSDCCFGFLIWRTWVGADDFYNKKYVPTFISRVRLIYHQENPSLSRRLNITTSMADRRVHLWDF